jgi:hypothetical protein
MVAFIGRKGQEGCRKIGEFKDHWRIAEIL